VGSSSHDTRPACHALRQGTNHSDTAAQYQCKENQRVCDSFCDCRREPCHRILAGAGVLLGSYEALELGGHALRLSPHVPSLSAEKPDVDCNRQRDGNQKD
jgi:hypothetical protein